MSRVSLKDYKIPGTDFVIEKGTRVMIPIDAIQSDPAIYEEPDRFDPERFSADELKKRHSLTWLPFGEGPRNCIGQRFGKIQVKVGIVSLLRNFKYTACKKTQVPYKMDLRSYISDPVDGIFLEVSKL